MLFRGGRMLGNIRGKNLSCESNLYLEKQGRGGKSKGEKNGKRDKGRKGEGISVDKGQAQGDREKRGKNG